jgi:hypothetical protein
MMKLDMSLIDNRCNSAGNYAIFFSEKISCLCVDEKWVLDGELFLQFLNERRDKQGIFCIKTEG